MKMGNIVSLWRYDVAIRHAIQLAKLRRPAILRYASWPTACPISPGAHPPRLSASVKGIFCGILKKLLSST
jgi:hypothetical protein